MNFMLGFILWFMRSIPGSDGGSIWGSYGAHMSSNWDTEFTGYRSLLIVCVPLTRSSVVIL